MEKTIKIAFFTNKLVYFLVNNMYNCGYKFCSLKTNNNYGYCCSEHKLLASRTGVYINSTDKSWKVFISNIDNIIENSNSNKLIEGDSENDLLWKLETLECIIPPCKEVCLRYLLRGYCNLNNDLNCSLNKT